MPRVENEVIINAPVEHVYNYVSQPSNLPQVWPSLYEIKDEKIIANGGYSYRWTYKMGGMHFTGNGECVGCVTNSVLSSKNSGPIDSTVTFTFRSKGIQTKVTLTIDYRVHLPLVGQLTEIIIHKMNEKEAALILDNMRIRLET
jgi:uncharacterized membrane protein